MIQGSCNVKYIKAVIISLLQLLWSQYSFVSITAMGICYSCHHFVVVNRRSPLRLISLPCADEYQT